MVNRVDWLKPSIYLGLSVALWLASLSPVTPIPMQGLCLVVALVCCGLAVGESKRGIGSVRRARTEQGLRFDLWKQEIALQAQVALQKIQHNQFPDVVEDPTRARERLEQAYQNEQPALQVTPELWRAISLLHESGYSKADCAQAVLGSAEAVGAIEQILQIGREQEWQG